MNKQDSERIVNHHVGSAQCELFTKTTEIKNVEDEEALRKGFLFVNKQSAKEEIIYRFSAVSELKCQSRRLQANLRKQFLNCIFAAITARIDACRYLVNQRKHATAPGLNSRLTGLELTLLCSTPFVGHSRERLRKNGPK